MHSTDNLSKLPQMGKLSPEATNAFWAYDKAALAGGGIPRHDGLISTKIAMAVLDYRDPGALKAIGMDRSQPHGRSWRKMTKEPPSPTSHCGQDIAEIGARGERVCKSLILRPSRQIWR